MARKAAAPKKTEKPGKPELFVGSSGEAVPLANAVVQVLQHQFRVTPWTAGVFEPSSTTLADLARQLDKSAYGVFIFAKDNQIRSRGKQYDAARDNVLFELGLFMGRLGPENCFIVVPKDRKKLKIPSDLEGFNPVSYDEDRLTDNPQAALAPACAAISDAIARREKEKPSPPSADTALAVIRPTPPRCLRTRGCVPIYKICLVWFTLALPGWRSSSDREKFLVWARNVLHMAYLALQAVTRNLPSDAYVAWLRPTAEDQKRLTFFLGENTPPDFAPVHHPFSLGEGLAGSVWSEGQAASHSSAQPHPKWRPRAECRNESYGCVPVGSAAGAGGILGFGSDQGFETEVGHISTLETFASLLAAVVPAAAWWKANKGGKTRRRG